MDFSIKRCGLIKNLFSPGHKKTDKLIACLSSYERITVHLYREEPFSEENRLIFRLNSSHDLVFDISWTYLHLSLLIDLRHTFF
jgi:hypothetical protein